MKINKCMSDISYVVDPVKNPQRAGFSHTKKSCVKNTSGIFRDEDKLTNDIVEMMKAKDSYFGRDEDKQLIKAKDLHFDGDKNKSSLVEPHQSFLSTDWKGSQFSKDDVFGSHPHAPINPYNLQSSFIPYDSYVKRPNQRKEKHISKDNGSSLCNSIMKKSNKQLYSPQSIHRGSKQGNVHPDSFHSQLPSTQINSPNMYEIQNDNTSRHPIETMLTPSPRNKNPAKMKQRNPKTNFRRNYQAHNLTEETTNNLNDIETKDSDLDSQSYAFLCNKLWSHQDIDKAASAFDHVPSRRFWDEKEFASFTSTSAPTAVKQGLLISMNAKNGLFENQVTEQKEQYLKQKLKPETKQLTSDIYRTEMEVADSEHCGIDNSEWARPENSCIDSSKIPIKSSIIICEEKRGDDISHLGFCSSCDDESFNEIAELASGNNQPPQNMYSRCYKTKEVQTKTLIKTKDRSTLVIEKKDISHQPKSSFCGKNTLENIYDKYSAGLQRNIDDKSTVSSFVQQKYLGFKILLNSKNIRSDTCWEEVSAKCSKDPRWTIYASNTDRRQAFMVYQAELDRKELQDLRLWRKELYGIC